MSFLNPYPPFWHQSHDLLLWMPGEIWSSKLAMYNGHSLDNKDNIDLLYYIDKQIV
jgi:hypothetical protein